MALPVFSAESIMRRRNYLAGAAGIALSFWQPVGLTQNAHNLVSVWKTPNCGCCQAWILHLQANGFRVSAVDVPDTAPIRKDKKMPAALGSCHTAVIGNYVIEGHVPAEDIKRLLRDRPRALGLSVPGMPMGSPGMESATKKDPYQVLLVLENGSTRVYQSYS